MRSVVDRRRRLAMHMHVSIDQPLYIASVCVWVGGGGHACIVVDKSSARVAVT
jgi:hypothetical protein